MKTSISVWAFAIGLLSLNYAATAAEFETKHKLLIQVSTGDPLTQEIALNNALNALKLYGPENITVEVVAYGPGLSIMTPENKQSSRIPALAQNGIVFSACAITMKKLAKKTGKEVELVKGVTIVPGGVSRIIELQEAGYVYIRP